MIRGQNYLNLTFFAVAKAQKGRHARPFRGELFKTSVGERFLQQPKARRIIRPSRTFRGQTYLKLKRDGVFRGVAEIKKRLYD